jgi:hypothetical protein
LNTPVGSSIEEFQQINALINHDQVMAIYLVEFYCAVAAMEVSTNVVISINPAFQVAQKDAFVADAQPQSNNVIASANFHKCAQGSIETIPEAFQFTPVPKVLCNNFYVRAIKYGGSSTPDCFVTIWYRVFNASDIERHMIRRFYG